MENRYDTIVWGSSPRGIARAIALKNCGKKVLLASRFGFPGGKHTESLAAFFGLIPSHEDSLEQKLVSQAAGMHFGILHHSTTGLLLHPETIKRICWQWINEAGIPVLFHVLPAGTVRNGRELTVKFFGREGYFSLTAESIEDYSDNIPLPGIEPNRHYNMIIHAFFSNPLPLSVSGFNLVRNINTSIGPFVSLSVRRVAGSELDTTFNRELNRLSIEGWSKYRSRIRMIPVYPEISPA
ncbi:MAG TPA: FAD-dependent oxidoreductase [Bacteroidales bacterium]|nr:FAD-dependent oxidoreductase [Bacteroidales bacterium]